MNGTPTSENTNFEAGIISIHPSVIRYVDSYFDLVEKDSKCIS